MKLRQFFGHYPYLTLVLSAGLAAGLSTIWHAPKVAHGFIIIVAFFVALHLLREIIGTLRSGQYGVDLLAFLAIASTTVLGEYWAALVICLMLSGGEALEDFAEHRAQRELNALTDRIPRQAYLCDKKGTVKKEIAVNKLQAGEYVLVRPGEIVPADGTLVGEEALFDESMLTGESKPAEKRQGQEVLSGSIVTDSAVVIRVVRSAHESQYEQIVELVKHAIDNQPPFVRVADKVAVPFTIIALVIAGVAWAVTGEALRFAEVLVVATPCPLLIAAPVAFIAGMSRAAKHGIIVKSSAAIERMAHLKTMAFDKTGTLTNGTLEVAKIVAVKGTTQDELLQLAASAEQQSNHILAHSLVTAATAKKLKLQTPRKLQEVTAKGVIATLKKEIVYVGKRSWLVDEGIRLPAKGDDTTSAYVVVDGQYRGVIHFADQVREEAATTLKELHRLGVVESIMVTGDQRSVAEEIAKGLPLERIEAECLPADKLRFVREIGASQRPIAFVGDGVNDAPVLAASDVGIAMGARGATAASESADVVIMLDRLDRVAEMMRIAKRTMGIAWQSILVGVGLSILFMFIAATGRIPALAGAWIQEAIDVLVIFNALRALR
ncbi:MAG TPA: heavy metal translocating P-type ATPase [Candidatus Saccharimonadales bacterium]|nr:heavy metal translocating P-type ATPase [Candidatus Saccharimonadales bacterium]